MLVGLDTTIAVNLILLLTGWSGISYANILKDIPKNNPLNIDWYPAPSPEDGPPLSAGALRNPAYLPAEIGGIVGAYLFSVFIVGVALILVGRKLRRQVLQSAKALDIEMVEARTQVYYSGPSPITPSEYPGSPRNFSWPSPEKTDRNPYIFPTTGGPKSPHGADSFVDRRIVEADQEMLQRDLEDIYAHVMEQEDAKAAGVKVKEMPPPPPLLKTSLPPAPPQRSATLQKIEKVRPSNLMIDEPKFKSHSRASSIISSLKSPKRRGIRGMMISDPIPTPLSMTFPSDGNASDEEPLSPRYYAPPPPPPIPKDQVPYTHARKNSRGSPVTPMRSTAEQFLPYGVPQSHRPNPSQTSVQSRDPASASSATSQTPLFPAQSQRQPPYPNKSTSTVNLPPSNNSSVRQLPLRHFEPALQSPSFTYSTKTTVLERSNPLSPGLTTGGGPKTPWSAGAVPYSPYQPFTPMMPITPRLVTRQERKAMKKIEARTPTLEMIKSEDEIFASGW
jgi:hypothetical protein